MIENQHTEVVYRFLKQDEERQAIELWQTVFKTPEGFFERYTNEKASPFYCPGDTIGAWLNDKLVSAVHIRRLRLRSRDDETEYLCGAIANVATLEDQRRQGHSRTLLRMAIKFMEENQFDISVLGTGFPNHYAKLGWEKIILPSPINIEWRHFNSSTDPHHWHSSTLALSQNGQALLDIHSNKPRTYQFSRSPLSMFQNWTGWNWKRDNALIYILPDQQSGYVVITNVDNIEEIYVCEWRASNVDIERKLLRLAANEIRRRHPQITTIRVHTPPQYMTLEELEQWSGNIIISKNDHTMIRNICLSTENLDKIKAAYLSGHATFWTGDYF